MPTLYIMCGPSGSGKSTYVKNYNWSNNIKYVSRDEIRFSLLKDNEDYFAHEKETFKKFFSLIVKSLRNNEDVIADATHLNIFSRKKLTDTIDKYFTDYTIIYVVMNTSLDEILRRNANREGRARVQASTLRSMYNNFNPPTFNEDKRIIDIWEVRSEEDE